MNNADYVYVPGLQKKIARIGFGCCPMGQYGWGVVDKAELIKSVHAALDHGINFFDTADIYGVGHSENVLGEALKKRRHGAIIATKFGVRINHGKTVYDTSPRWIRQALELSLSRLRTDYIDLYQMHYWDGKTDLNEIFGLLEDLRREGKIAAFGVTNTDLVASGFDKPIDNLASFSFEYSLANRNHEQKIVRNNEKLGLCFISWGSLGQGILSGKYTNETKFANHDRRSRPIYVNFHGDKLLKNLEIVKTMQEISSKIGHSLPQIAVRWVLDHLGFGVVLVGIKNPAQLIDFVGAFDWFLTNQELAILDAISAE